MATALESEVDRNLFAFLPQLPNLLRQHQGHFALLRDQKIVSLHEKLSEALEAGSIAYADGLFSIQQVSERPIELGFYSYADHSR